MKVRRKNHTLRSTTVPENVLGPPLCTIFLVDCLQYEEPQPNIEVKAEKELSADDPMVHAVGKTSQEAIANHNTALIRNTEWVEGPDLTFNNGNCVHMATASSGSRRWIDLSTDTAKLGGHQLEQKGYVRYLGVNTAQYLQWNQHLEQAKQKSMRESANWMTQRKVFPKKHGLLCTTVHYAFSSA
ncbi:hypothetical protein RvY_18384 [Ramazzottius varieornatus]|uniref:Reverse transcriptase domain-containing protein n=1 Tax=Ramazzottius varieornatus TaxID=947166 RepID=A0A1D1W5K0_RAMVA|nr:hypothetical protein RvY_18384 [Ramazzottius varieornatus]